MPPGSTRGNDRADARTIAQFTTVVVEGVPPQRRRDLDPLVELLTYRRQLQDWGTYCANQFEHLRDGALRKKIARQQAGFGRELKRIDEKLARLVAEHDDWKVLARRLRTVPGVGPVVATTLIASLPELGSLSRRAIASPPSQGQAPATAAGGA